MLAIRTCSPVSIFLRCWVQMWISISYVFLPQCCFFERDRTIWDPNYIQVIQSSQELPSFQVHHTNRYQARSPPLNLSLIWTYATKVDYLLKSELYSFIPVGMFQILRPIQILWIFHSKCWQAMCFLSSFRYLHLCIFFSSLILHLGHKVKFYKFSFYWWIHFIISILK